MHFGYTYIWSSKSIYPSITYKLFDYLDLQYIEEVVYLNKVFNG